MYRSFLSSLVTIEFEVTCMELEPKYFPIYYYYSWSWLITYQNLGYTIEVSINIYIHCICEVRKVEWRLLRSG